MKKHCERPFVFIVLSRWFSGREFREKALLGSLAKFFGKEKLAFREVPPSEFAHCIIDVQREFCDPDCNAERASKETARLANHIANIAPLFRKAMIPTYIVYYSFFNEGLKEACGGLYKIKIKNGDVPVAKKHNSAFQGSNINELLKKEGIKTLLVSGFNLNACVRETVLDGLSAGFNVWVLADCVGNDNFCEKNNTEKAIRAMKEAGAAFKDHSTALNDVRRLTADKIRLAKL